MKVKKINIKVMDIDEYFNHVESVLENYNKGKYKEYPSTVSFANLTLLRKILSPRRVQLMSVIKHKKPESIYELAKMVNRERKSVITDINILNELGFVKLKRYHKEREIVKPEVNFEEIDIGVKI